MVRFQIDLTRRIIERRSVEIEVSDEVAARVEEFTEPERLVWAQKQAIAALGKWIREGGVRGFEYTYTELRRLP
jgi:hypothetical protein